MIISDEYVIDWPVKGSLTPIDIVSDVLGLTESELRKVCKVIYIDDTFDEDTELIKQPDIDTIIGTVCHRFKIDQRLIHLRTRKREVIEPRQLIHTLVFFGLGKTLALTGELVGSLDHSTVLYGISKVSERYTTYADYRKTVNQLVRSLWSDTNHQQYITDRIIDRTSPHIQD